MKNWITGSLVLCVMISAVGGFGAPFFCTGSNSEKCSQNWRDAAAGSLAASGFLGTLLAQLAGADVDR